MEHLFCGSAIKIYVLANAAKLYPMITLMLRIADYMSK
jgi:hypothetical protein